MSTVVSLICFGPSFQKMSNQFLRHGSFRPTNLEKNLKPCVGINMFVPKDMFYFAWSTFCSSVPWILYEAAGLSYLAFLQADLNSLGQWESDICKCNLM